MNGHMQIKARGKHMAKHTQKYASKKRCRNIFSNIPKAGPFHVNKYLLFRSARHHLNRFWVTLMFWPIELFFAYAHYFRSKIMRDFNLKSI